MFKGIWHYRMDFGVPRAISLAKQTGANTLILKCGTHEPVFTGPFVPIFNIEEQVKQCRDNGLDVYAEVFSMPRTIDQEAEVLRRAVAAGVKAVVINAETPYEATDGVAMRLLLRKVGSLRVPIHACTDFRGNRLTLPYHKELAKVVSAWHPMVYSQAFYPNNPFGDVQRAFDDVYWRWRDLRGQLPTPGKDAPLLPVIQAYSGRDYEETLGSIVLAWRWGSPGSSVYVSHDVNDRAKWGIRDGWDVVERASTPSIAATTLRVSSGGVYRFEVS